MPHNVGKMQYCDNGRVIFLPYLSINCSEHSSVALNEYGIFRSIIIANYSFAGLSKGGSDFSKTWLGQKQRLHYFPKVIKKVQRRIQIWSCNNIFLIN